MSETISSTTEEWKAIPGYEGRYEVSNMGRIKSFAGHTGRLGGEKILKPYTSKNGYLRVCLYSQGRCRYIEIHRLVLLSFRGKDSTRNHGNHIDRNKANNGLNNLEWCTPLENVIHTLRSIHGIWPRPQVPKVAKPTRTYHCGENHYGHKLTEDAIHQVRRLRMEGKSQQAIADKFGVVQTTISKILHGHKWKHVKSTP